MYGLSLHLLMVLLYSIARYRYICVIRAFSSQYLCVFMLFLLAENGQKTADKFMSVQLQQPNCFHSPAMCLFLVTTALLLQN